MSGTCAEASGSGYGLVRAPGGSWASVICGVEWSATLSVVASVLLVEYVAAR